ncbi:hypothetical protein ACS8VC_001120 [Morganella morganii]
MAEVTVTDDLLDVIGKAIQTMLTSIKENTGACRGSDIKKVASVIYETTKHLNDDSEVDDAIYAYLAQTIFS